MELTFKDTYRENRPKLTLIRGCPGSGKSTYAKNHYNCLILENDMFHRVNGEYMYDTDNMKNAMKWCFNMCECALANGMDVVVANTLTRKRFIQSYVDLALAYGADFEVLRCTADYGNTHNVPKYVLESMRNGFEDWPGEVIVN